jgi:hypothetical protein
VRGGAVTLARAEAALLRQPLTLLYQSSEEKRPVVLMTDYWADAGADGGWSNPDGIRAECG